MSWKERISRQVDGRTEYDDVKRKGKKDVFKFNAPCFTFSVETLNPGDYTIPFSFLLPQGLHSSINFKKTDIFASPKAKVKYTIKALLNDRHGKTKMSYKQVLIVREMGEAF